MKESMWSDSGYGFVDFDCPNDAALAVKNLQAKGVQAQMAKVSVKLDVYITCESVEILPGIMLLWYMTCGAVVNHWNIYAFDTVLCKIIYFELWLY